MENELEVFTNEQFGEIRVTEIDGSVWFVGKDVAEALGYKDSADALKSHVEEDDKRHVKVGEIPTLKTSNFGAYLINESGLYSLILSSKLEKAKSFKHWVTSEVLPSIRKTGTYSIEYKKSEREIALLEDTNRVKKAEIIKSIGEKSPVQTYRNICDALAVNIAANGNYLPLPKPEHKTYKATELAKEFGVTPQLFGSLANKNNVKTSDNGEIIWDLGKNGKQIENFVYYESGREVMRNLCTNYKSNKEAKNA